MSKGSNERALGVGSAHVEGYVPKHYLPEIFITWLQSSWEFN